MVKGDAARTPDCGSGDRRRQSAQGQRLSDEQCRRLPQRRENPAAAGLRPAPRRRIPRRLRRDDCRNRWIREADDSRRTLHAGGTGGAEGVSDRAGRARTGVAVRERHLSGGGPPRRCRLRAAAAPALVSHAATNWSRSASGSARWPTRASRCQLPLRTRDGREYVSVSIPGDRREAFRRPGALDRRDGAGRGAAREDRHQDRRTAISSSSAPSPRRCTTRRARWRPPAAFRRHALDADGFMGEAPYWGPFWDHQELSPPNAGCCSTRAERLHAALARFGRHPPSTA